MRKPKKIKQSRTTQWKPENVKWRQERANGWTERQNELDKLRKEQRKEAARRDAEQKKIEQTMKQPKETKAEAKRRAEGVRGRHKMKPVSAALAGLEEVKIALRDIRRRSTKIEQIDLADIEALAAAGSNKSEIGVALGVAGSTFCDWCRENEDLNLAFERGRANGNAMVALANLKTAMMPGVQGQGARLLHLKTHAGWTDKVAEGDSKMEIKFGSEMDGI